MQEPAGLHGELLLRPVRSGNSFEETVQRLLQTVRLGLVKPGERLPAERELATMLAVSRDTVREAIASLSDAGYVVSRRGRYGGTFVNEELPARGTDVATDAALSDGTATSPPAYSAETIEDVLTLREVLEVGAARCAAGRTLTPHERELLWSSLAEANAATGDEYRRLDSRFHIMIGELAGSASLTPLIADVRMRVNELLDSIPLLGPNITHSNQQHEQIALAILSGRADAAAHAMSEHLTGTSLLLRGFLE